MWAWHFGGIQRCNLSGPVGHDDDEFGLCSMRLGDCSANNCPRFAKMFGMDFKFNEAQELKCVKSHNDALVAVPLRECPP